MYNEYSDEDCMEMPTPCQHCNHIFDLNDGYGSEKWYPGTVICERCHGQEEKEIEIDNEVQDLVFELRDAEYTIEDCNKIVDNSLERLKELGYDKHGEKL